MLWGPAGKDEALDIQGCQEHKKSKFHGQGWFLRRDMSTLTYILGQHYVL